MLKIIRGWFPFMRKPLGSFYVLLAISIINFLIVNRALGFLFNSRDDLALMIFVIGMSTVIIVEITCIAAFIASFANSGNENQN